MPLYNATQGSIATHTFLGLLAKIKVHYSSLLLGPSSVAQALHCCLGLARPNKADHWVHHSSLLLGPSSVAQALHCCLGLARPNKAKLTFESSK
ncbi:hypothetical protein U9M48_009645 [Paspalum notatum var. saurae]|uniref:Uncharacterized protein n=1 Tax=Paspalum notatum var. saurae TaxID=547442 RepID=A0AAQ3SRD2_PASNO